MNTILKNTISITVITLVAGLALGVVQDITAGPIATQQEKSKEEAATGSTAERLNRTSKKCLPQGSRLYNSSFCRLPRRN